MPRRGQAPVEVDVAIDALPADVAGALASDVAAETPPADEAAIEGAEEEHVYVEGDTVIRLGSGAPTPS